ncbi:MAG: YncE family protein [Ignavibacteriota bacterium]
MRYVALCILISMGLLACTHIPTEPLIGNYPPEISHLISANCLGGDCHTGASTANTGLDLTTWDQMTRGSSYFNEVIPFNAVRSHMFGHVNTNPNLGPVFAPSMPYARDPLSRSDQIAIFNWIIQGAKNADGKVPYSDITKKLFVVNQEENTISVIDAQSQRLVRVVLNSGGGKPTAITLSGDKKSFFVADQDPNGTIAKYDIETYAKQGEFTTKLVCGDVAITKDGAKGYTIDNSYGGKRFVSFDPIGMKLLSTFSSPLLRQPAAIVIAPVGEIAYICGFGSDNVLRIDTRNDSVMASIPVGDNVPVPIEPTYIAQYQPRKIVLSSDGKTMYLSCQATSEIVVLDLENDSITARIPIQYGPWGEALRPKSSELWVCNYISNQVSVVGTKTNTVIATIDSVNNYPRAITFTPDGKYAFVACELLTASSGHAHGGDGQPSSAYVVIDCGSRKIVSTQDLPALSTGIVTAYEE